MNEQEKLVEVINKELLAGATEKELRIVYIAVKEILKK